MKSTTQQRLTLSGLLLLGLVPNLAGAVRLVSFATKTPLTPRTAHFFESPLPALLHIVSANIYSILGAFQFIPRRSDLHRRTGRLIAVSGAVVSLTGIWMTLAYPQAPHEGAALLFLRLTAGGAMLYCLARSEKELGRRDYVQHGAWMTRAYALGMGAGTQVFTQLPYILYPSLQNEFVKTLAMGLGWTINLLIAERIIIRRKKRRMS